MKLTGRTRGRVDRRDASTEGLVNEAGVNAVPPGGAVDASEAAWR